MGVRVTVYDTQAIREAHRLTTQDREELAHLIVSDAIGDAPVETGEFANVGTVSGSGVLATGWRFPDAVMANGVPYISATSGKPSIKVGGVVEAYTG